MRGWYFRLARKGLRGGCAPLGEKRCSGAIGKLARGWSCPIRRRRSRSSKSQANEDERPTMQSSVEPLACSSRTAAEHRLPSLCAKQAVSLFHFSRLQARWAHRQECLCSTQLEQQIQK